MRPTDPNAAAPRRVVVVGLMAASIVSFRGQMLQAMAAHGHDVLAMAPESDAEVTATLKGWGVHYRATGMSRTGMNPLRDLGMVGRLARVFRSQRADTVLVYGAKPVIYGLIAARLARVRTRSAMITGAGSALIGGPGMKRRVLSWLMRSMYAVALRQATVVFFQNPDDERLFRRWRLIGRRCRTVRINGSGVDLERFAAVPLPDGAPTFLMVGRLLRDKGLMEYAEAAHRAHEAHPDAQFQLLGPTDSNPSAIPLDQVESWVAQGFLDYLGSTDDVRPYLRDAQVFVLPSYGEGMPRSALEALAIGRPVITTDVPGCRETVVDGRNGQIVAPRDATALATAMIDMLERRSEWAAMGDASRRLAEERFDVHQVNATILQALGLGAGEASVRSSAGKG